jgi:hypothetical protein
MAKKKDQHKQKTEKGHEIPVPRRSDFYDNLKKAADVPSRPRRSRKKK